MTVFFDRRSILLVLAFAAASPRARAAQAPPALDAAADGLDYRSLDRAAWDEYDAAFVLDGSDEAQPSEKALRWRRLAREVPMFSAMAGARAAQWEAFAPGTRESGKGGVRWVTISSGSFMMGSTDPDLSDARPAHRVTLKSFQMAKTLVTNKQYKACAAAGACTAAHYSDGKCTVYTGSWHAGALPDSFQGDDQPVVCVTREEAEAFSKWAGGRLPSEAEWEYAARSEGRDWRYPWGDEDATCERALIRGCGDGTSAPACSRPAGNTRQGLCDMAGNAWEWTQDSYHDSYAGAPSDGGAWRGAGSFYVARGGSLYDPAGPARSAYRDVVNVNPEFLYNIGFRPAREVSASRP